MRWQLLATSTVLIVAGIGLAVWQWDEYRHECDIARASVARSAESVMGAFVGGVRSHYRVGTYFLEQVQGALDELAKSPDVRAIAFTAADGKAVMSAGELALLPMDTNIESGEAWLESGYRLVATCPLPLEGGGPGDGRGGGPGLGRSSGRRWSLAENESRNGFEPGTTATVTLLVDRSRADTTIQRAAWVRGAIVVGGSGCLLGVAFTWHILLRLVAARGQARVLQLEANYYRDLSQAAAGLAHETRNPLGLIRGWAQRLTDADEEHAEYHQQVQAIIEECDRVTARINQFLAFARPSEPICTEFDLAAVVSELAIILTPDLDEKQLALQGPAVGHQITADREMLRQILFNLIQNAIQAGPAGSVIEVRCEQSTAGRLRMEVLDRGPGVAPEVVPKLFTPYFTTRADGTGLGLAIVRRLAAAHGWNVGYSPRDGGGSIFWLEVTHG